jgi:hypothetical protein
MESPHTNSTPNRINWIAVIGGFLLDTLLSTLVFGVAARFDPALSTDIVLTTGLGVFTAGLLMLCTGIGGWLAARLARMEYVLHGVLVGGLGILVMLLESLLTGQARTLNQIVLQSLAVVVGGIGGWLSGRTQEPRQ